MADLLEKAIAFATEKHAGQKYGDKPYITHCLAVLERVEGYTSDKDVLCAAVLHDVIEDCGITRDELERMFGVFVAEWVETLTRTNEESYSKYIYRVDKTPIASLIKYFDLEENISNNPSKHLRDKYELAMLYLRK